MFHEQIDMYPNPPTGGSGKLQNALSRLYTRSVIFGSVAFSEFLWSLMSYHYPLDFQGEEWKDKWTDPGFIDDFWTTYLQNNTLEPDNRVVHTIDTQNLIDINSVSTFHE